MLKLTVWGLVRRVDKGGGASDTSLNYPLSFEASSQATVVQE